MSAVSDAHVGIYELAGLAARAIAVELVLFETLGWWTSTTTQAGAKPTLAAASRRHAWHAGLWRERFPLIPDADADELVAGARSRLGPLVDALGTFDALPSGPGRLAVAGVAAAELVRDYRVVTDSIDPLLDAPTARVLELVIADLEAAPTPTGELADDERAALEALHAAAPFLTLGVA